MHLHPRGITYGQPPLMPNICMIAQIRHIRITPVPMELIRIMDGTIKVFHTNGNTRYIMVFQYRYADHRVNLFHQTTETGPNTTGNLYNFGITTTPQMIGTQYIHPRSTYIKPPAATHGPFVPIYICFSL